jgi:adenylate cyclase
MSGSEIERKFLLSALPDDLQQHPYKAISQGYISTASESEVRVRRHGSSCVLTVKKGSGLRRTEVEINIDEAQFLALWELTVNQRIEKTRYDYHYLDTLIEIDVYRDSLAPLTLAEVEFSSIEESRHFSVPSFFGREVTDERAYKNAALAVHGIPEDHAGNLL